MPKSAQWCFTYNFSIDNEPTPDECKAAFKPDDRVTYFCYQLERGANGGRLHLQGFAQTKTMSFGEFKTLFRDRTVHVEAAKALDLEKARDYCRKPEGRVEGPWERGEFRNRAAPGKRTDLDQIVKQINDGASVEDVARTNGATFIRNYRGIREYASIVNPEPKRDGSTPCDIWVYQGVTGSGKSRRARERCGERVYLKSPEHWWCGYNARDHDFVLFEEFEGPDWMPPTVLLQILDRYATTIVARGRQSIQLSCLKFVFTSNSGVRNWYKGTKYEKQWYEVDDITGEMKKECKLAAFMRRVTEGQGDCFHFDRHWDDQTEDEHKEM